MIITVKTSSNRNNDHFSEIELFYSHVQRSLNQIHDDGEE
jgi:hypothetical protein